MDYYAGKSKVLIIRHTSGDRVVAMVEVVSPGNKASRHALRDFVEKAAVALTAGIHLLVIDVNRPTPRDPHGVHGAIWSEISDEGYLAPPDKPLTLVSYAAGTVKVAYIQPVGVGDQLINMPLFLTPRSYLSVGLEETYRRAWEDVPPRWQEVLQGPAS